eukprot:TRINITY_DN106915_c0_g1_i1.p1 TRINITY_DN106915_c0_g1~~TRINITY_DN106915_c0_g1_i1.p1  ORF type:complete len:468 (-),score=88.03 TRINITY_DN106915_c0_g1_i1:38-1441(-)
MALPVLRVALKCGETLGPYQVQQLIGRGSFGMVLAASEVRTLQKTALKIVPCDHLDSAQASKAREAALSEASILKRLLHPNIVTCYDMCWDAERAIVWLALEYMDGGDIQAVLSNRRASAGEPFEACFVRQVLASIGSALRFVHRENILHRDVKPGNMLLSHRWSEAQPGVTEIKLADFGIAKLIEATGSARTVIGTPLYLAPEMVSGRMYGPATDAWALGVCLYELATLQRPFEAGNQLALARQIVDEPHEPVPEDLPQDLAQAIAGLLEKDEHQRMNLGQALRLSPEIRELLIDGPTCIIIEALEELPSTCSTPRPESTAGSTVDDIVAMAVPKPPGGPLSTAGSGGTVSPRRVAPAPAPAAPARGGARSPRPAGGWWRPDGQPAPPHKEKKGSRTWFSFLRPSRSKETCSDGEATESTCAVSAFSYPEDSDDSGDDAPRPTPKATPPREKEVEPERPHAMRAWQ